MERGKKYAKSAISVVSVVSVVGVVSYPELPLRDYGLVLIPPEVRYAEKHFGGHNVLDTVWSDLPLKKKLLSHQVTFAPGDATLWSTARTPRLYRSKYKKNS